MVRDSAKQGTLAKSYTKEIIHLGNTINEGPGQGWHPVGQNSCIAPLQQHPKSSPEVGDCFPFLLPRVSCQGRPQLLHLVLRIMGMKAIPCWRQSSSAPLIFVS